MPTTSIPSARPRIGSRPRSRVANGGAELNRSIAAREARKPPSTLRLSSSSRAAVFMTSPLKTMARLMSPISPTITGPKCRLPRIRGTAPNSCSNWPDACASASRIAVKHRSGRHSIAPLLSRKVDEKHEAVFLDGRMIPPGDEVEKRARPDNVGDPERQIHQNRDHGGIDKAEPEILTGGVEGQSGDDLTCLRKLDDDDNRCVDHASYNEIGRERKTAEPNPHRTIQDEQFDPPDR